MSIVEFDNFCDLGKCKYFVAVNKNVVFFRQGQSIFKYSYAISCQQRACAV